jgi:hypothetical protein
MSFKSMAKFVTKYIAATIHTIFKGRERRNYSSREQPWWIEVSAFVEAKSEADLI